MKKHKVVQDAGMSSVCDGGVYVGRKAFNTIFGYWLVVRWQ